MVIVQGWDLALNHCGCVELTDGELSNFWYLTNNKTSYKRSAGTHGRLLGFPKDVDKQQMHMLRLFAINTFLFDIVLTNHIDYVGIEDYALMANTYSHLKGEVGGAARTICYTSDVPFRLHDPLSVKMFTTGKGNAKKDKMEQFVQSRWGVNFTEYNKSEKDHTTSEDLCDAYAVAKMIWTEVQLRAGDITLKDLEQHERRVFNRVTKSYPTNILGRNWIGDD